MNNLTFVLPGCIVLGVAFASFHYGKPDVAAAIATFVAVIVALYQDKIMSLWRRPYLTASIRLAPPDCLPTPVQVSGERDLWVGNAYFFRLWIQNDGMQAATRVQVFVRTVGRVLGDGQTTKLIDFVPMNLRWSNSQSDDLPTIYESINPKMGKHCDFGSVGDPNCPYEKPRDGMKKGESTFNLLTEVFPLNQGHRLLPGKYRIELQVAAENAEPRTLLVELEWTGAFQSDQHRMFGESVKIKLT